jgi:membrane protease YdiL (CAAX protease family)
MATDTTGQLSTADRSPVAPVWHTVLFIVVFTGLSLVSVRTVHNFPAHGARMRLYAVSVASEVAMVLYVWLLGLRLRGKTMREVIGGRWSRASDVLMDVAVAILFWIAVVAVLAVLRLVLHTNGPAAIRDIEPLLPQTGAQMAAFVGLAVTAGFCEEFLFRGYLQRQFLAWTGIPSAAVVLQAVVFGFGHMYQGWRNALGITVYGAMFGILALMRKSLRPGMIQHAMQDSVAGILGSVLVRRGYF